MPSYILTDWDTEDEPYTLIGIHASIEPYRMAYKLNKHLKTSFARTVKDQDVTMPSYVSHFPVYKYQDMHENTAVYLTPNKYWGKLKENSSAQGLFSTDQIEEVKTILVKEFATVDFLLKIEKEKAFFPVKKWLHRLNEIPHVISAYELDHLKIKNQDYLIFE
jgi:delta 1-pyrroline-5-carboxylate dehydrogenase